MPHQRHDGPPALPGRPEPLVAPDQRSRGPPRASRTRARARPVGGDGMRSLQLPGNAVQVVLVAQISGAARSPARAAAARRVGELGREPRLRHARPARTTRARNAAHPTPSDVQAERRSVSGEEDRGPGCRRPGCARAGATRACEAQLHAAAARSCGWSEEADGEGRREDGLDEPQTPSAGRGAGTPRRRARRRPESRGRGTAEACCCDSEKKTKTTDEPDEEEERRVRARAGAPQPRRKNASPGRKPSSEDRNEVVDRPGRFAAPGSRTAGSARG